MPFALAFIVGYVLGSIPFGLVFTKLSGGPDIRSIGSGNIGATNVLRTGNKKLAAATLAGDLLKGTAAVLLVSHFISFEAALVAGLGAFLGHLFPVWLRFKGGKGIATYIGILLGLAWPFALFFGFIWLGMAALFRYSSLASLTASAVTPIALWLKGQPKVAALFLLLTVLAWIVHRANIARLLNGTEGKIGQKG
jgi:glycerol-3-phosphate acyltransferase PlsY